MSALSPRRPLVALIATLASAALVSLGMHLFIFPADFAPSGWDGLATMLGEITHRNPGLFVPLLNAPLLVAAWFLLDRRYVLYTLLYTLSFSLFLLLWEALSIPAYTGGESWICVLFGGLAQGLTGIMLRIGASSGGADVLGSLLHLRLRRFHVERLISFVSLCVVLLSFFVYRRLESVLLSIAEIFVCEWVSASILRTTRSAVRFDVITDDPDELGDFILSELSHSASLLPVKGLHSQSQKTLLVCLVDRRQIPSFLRLLAFRRGIFAYYSGVLGVIGEFNRPL